MTHKRVPAMVISLLMFDVIFGYTILRENYWAGGGKGLVRATLIFRKIRGGYEIVLTLFYAVKSCILN